MKRLKAVFHFLAESVVSLPSVSKFLIACHAHWPPFVDAVPVRCKPVVVLKVGRVAVDRRENLLFHAARTLHAVVADDARAVLSFDNLREVSTHQNLSCLHLGQLLAL